jgi:hypothetical protein
MNWLEKNLPDKIREKLASLIVTALGLFLALQYNEAIKKIFAIIYPLDGETIFARILYVLVLTFIIVVAIYFVEKALDGK